jgi:hypothetical protein
MGLVNMFLRASHNGGLPCADWRMDYRKWVRLGFDTNRQPCQKQIGPGFLPARFSPDGVVAELAKAPDC